MPDKVITERSSSPGSFSKIVILHIYEYKKYEKHKAQGGGVEIIVNWRERWLQQTNWQTDKQTDRQTGWLTGWLTV